MGLQIHVLFKTKCKVRQLKILKLAGAPDSGTGNVRHFLCPRYYINTLHMVL